MNSLKSYIIFVFVILVHARIQFMSYTYYIYILASKRNGTLYIGVTNNLERRSFEHDEKVNQSFTKKYCINRLVYYELTNDITSAIEREKQLKHWKRKWKLKLIEEFNPNWEDLMSGFSHAQE
jgi:putative endonuclease